MLVSSRIDVQGPVVDNKAWFSYRDVYHQEEVVLPPETFLWYIRDMMQFAEAAGIQVKNLTWTGAIIPIEDEVGRAGLVD
jgi:hypothetical protein